MINTYDLINQLKPQTNLLLDLFKNQTISDDEKLPLICSIETSVKDLYFNAFKVMKDDKLFYLTNTSCKLVSCGKFYTRIRVIVNDENIKQLSS